MLNQLPSFRKRGGGLAHLLVTQCPHAIYLPLSGISGSRVDTGSPLGGLPAYKLSLAMGVGNCKCRQTARVSLEMVGWDEQSLRSEREPVNSLTIYSRDRHDPQQDVQEICTRDDRVTAPAKA